MPAWLGSRIDFATVVSGSLFALSNYQVTNSDMIPARNQFTLRITKAENDFK